MSESETIFCNGKAGAPSGAETIDPAPESPDGYCTNPAGWGTPHLGTGRCKLHGGANVDGGRPVEHGLHSKLRDDLREYVVQAASMDAPGDLRGELAVLRGLLYRRLAQSEELDSDLIDDTYKILSEMRRYSDTLHKQMTRERLTREEEQRLFNNVADVIQEYVPDSEQDEAFDELENAVGAGRANRALESG